MRVNVFTGIGILALLLSSACRTRSNKASSAPRLKTEVVMVTSMVPASALQPNAKVKNISGDQLKQRINSWQNFFAAAPEAPANSCATKIASALVSATDSIAMIATTVDLRSCANSDLQGSDMNATILSYTVKIAQSLRCSTGNLKSLNGTVGKNLLQRVLNLCRAPTLEFIQSNITESKLKLKIEGMDTNLQSTTFSETAATGQRPCVLRREENKGFRFVEPCISTTTNRSTTASAVAEGPIYEEADFSQSQAMGLLVPFKAARGSFYNSGTISFTFNNWGGTLTYKGTTAPTWQANNLMDKNESSSGTFGS